MPTVAEILAGIDSFVTPAKRRVVDMLMNPRAAMAQTAGRLSDDSNAALRDLNTQADANMLRAQGSVMADLPQYRQAEDASRARMVNALMNFAPIGVVAYHGTNAPPFTAFDPALIGSRDHGTAGAGVYGTANLNLARQYGNTVLKIESDPKNAIDFDKAMEIKAQLIKKMQQDGIQESQIEKNIGKELTTHLISLGHDAVSPSNSKWWKTVGDSWTFLDPSSVKVIEHVK